MWGQLRMDVQGVVCAGLQRLRQTWKHEAHHAILRRVRGGGVRGLEQEDHWLLHQPSRTWAQPGTHKLGECSGGLWHGWEWCTFLDVDAARLVKQAQRRLRRAHRHEPFEEGE